MMIKTHKLKTWPIYFWQVVKGDKRFEIRKTDRDYKTGDFLLLEEWDNQREEYTGRWILVEVMFMMSGGIFGIADGYCVMSIDPIEEKLMKEDK
jgi:hypothetical protein